MEFGEGTANVVFKQDDSADTREKIKIRIGVFFDGTLNNVTNINQRLMSAKDTDLTPEERITAADLKHNASQLQIDKAEKTYVKYGEPGADNSYEGYYTNIYKLYQYTNSMLGVTAGYDLVDKVYVDGPGTENEQKDDWRGFAFAMGPTGVPAKVKNGIEKVVSAIRKVADDKSKVIELLSIDVYGFSRGAAGARKFIHDALFGRRFVLAGGSLGGPDHDSTIRAQLEQTGYTISAPGAKTGVKVCFVGLFDTVSTYGIGVLIDEDDNVDALNLNAVFHAEETLHLTAAEEHRYHFSLTGTQSAGNRGKQYFLPGVHSDIGGGYRDDGDEAQPILGSIGFKDMFLLQSCDIDAKQADADKKTLIDMGWYYEEEIHIENHDYHINTPGMMKSGVPPRLVERRIESVDRKDIKNHYSTIPLQLMAKAAKEKGIVFVSKMTRDEKVPSELQEEYSYIQSYLNQQGHYSSSTSDWVDSRESWLKRLRHDYFHFSARMQPGHDPRIENGKRVRKLYRG